MKKIRIGDRSIGDGESVFIIAEAGINHNGKAELAKKLVREAKIAGADAIKFQLFRTEEFCNKNSEYFDLFKSLELEPKKWVDIANVALDVGIVFTASVFGEESADLLEEIGSPVYKIASGDLTYLSLLSYIAGKGKPIILSTGMSTISEIDEALREIFKTGNEDVALLHCVSNYPAEFGEMNLRAIQTLKHVFNLPVGFSDHSCGTIIATTAVAIGASLIEKHFTLNVRMQGPDHKLSLDPCGFKKMVEDIRLTERALGDGIKKPTRTEEAAKIEIRRSLVARESISKDEIITRKSIKIVRPGIGIEPRLIDLVLGRSARKNIVEDEVLTWDHV